MSINGLIGTWAGPYEPGTGYVMAHHSIGDVGDGTLGSWGVPEGGMGAVAEALERSARSFGAEVRTNARVAAGAGPRRPRRGRRARGRRGAARAVVVTACHPQITFLRQIDRARSCRPSSSTTSSTGRAARGVVKINLARRASSRACPTEPDWTDYSGGVRDRALARRSSSARSRRRGRGTAATFPFSDGVIPTVLDPSLAPRGHAHRLAVHAVGAAHVVARSRTARSSRRTPTA